MLKNYFKIAFRNLRKYKGYSIINIAGLAIGLACCFFIVIFVGYELSYDRFHEKSPRIYRLLVALAQNPGQRSAVTGSGFAPHLLNEFPEIEQAVRFFTAWNSVNFRYGGELRAVSGFVFADSSVFDVFSFRLRRGHPATALQRPNTMVLTSRSARAWFGDADPIGQTMVYLYGNQEVNLEVTGIVEDVPSNSHLQFDYLVSFTTLAAFLGKDALAEYTNFNYYTYLLLREGATPEQMMLRFPDFLRKYFDEETARQLLLFLQPLREIHLTTNVAGDIGAKIDPRYLYIFSAVGLIIMLIAVVNFVNLATARAGQRAKEIGVRKMLGAARRQLVAQMFSESILASVIAMILAVGVLEAAVPKLTTLIGRPITFDLFNNYALSFLLMGIALLTGLAAGVYPAMLLSAFEPIIVLKGVLTRGVKGARLRKALVVAQFSISVFLLIAVVTVYRQLHFMKSHDLGFNREQVVLVQLSERVKDHYEAFRAHLLSHPRIQNVALGSFAGSVETSRLYLWPGKEKEQTGSFYTMFVDAHTVEVLGLEVVQGRNFSEEIATDVTHAYILNETAVRELGWDNPVGRPFHVFDEEMGQVIGVVKDFHFKSLHQKIEPLVLDIKPEWSWIALIRVAPGDLRGTLDFIATHWRVFEPELPFRLRYGFLDSVFERLYRAEEQLGRLFSSFTFLAIFVAILGLFGLAAFAAEQRTKEIGIRKVLGATISNVVALLSKDFVKLVLLANFIAWPLAWYAMNRWLQNFAYRIEISWWVFALGGGLALVIALLTVSYHSIMTALTNPVNALRYE
ncbi:MAG: ABC transporter permease [candidate division KSB1 bacterium]|nr:ABC transporter permease [candidate division KSB1 bacterium]MDZ7305334.1 ABC transporter permease [candidate division KSB1 bacterium]MDZ7313379.1 ABC transporter permease [candidate division KSB1 bacterium]